MAGRPSGTVTFLFTDIEGSTRQWERDPGGMRSALVAHDEVLRRVIEGGGGAVFATAGDGFAAAFSRASAAVTAAIEAQRALAVCAWPPGLALKVRMGLHTGETQERGGDYFGPAVNRAARVMQAANGSQIFLSSSTRDVVVAELEPGTTLVDLGVHELRDVVEPMRLYRLEAGAFVSDRRPPRTGSVRAGNLPIAVAVLLGRDADVEMVIADLRTARVVTLVGVGGIGKTRLALEVGRRLQAESRDGVWFAALDTIDRPDAVAPTLLGMFGIEPRAERDLDSLIEGLRFRHALLILDNCEHVLDAAAEVASALVATCPHVQMLATSREPLEVEGERTRRTPPLNTDGAGAAVALFRLRAKEAGAALDRSGDADGIVRICRRLDGMPLAIELAAGRARSLRPVEIADRLDDMFRLLTSGRRSSVERHRTLRAALDWSHDLLGEAEKALLARLSVFAGSFPLDAAEAVGAGGPVAEEDVVDVIDRLVGRSLVVPVDESAESRFRLLEPVRQFAAEKLSARGETDAVREFRTRWCLDLIVSLAQRWRAGEDQETWPVAARELANLKAAFDDLVETGRTDEAQRFALAGGEVISQHFDNAPLYNWAPTAVSLDPGHVGAATASTCAMAAFGATAQGDLDNAAAWLRQGAAAIERGSQDEGLVFAGAVHLRLFGGPQALSDQFAQRSVEEALRSSDLYRQVWVLAYMRRGDEAVATALRLGNKMLVALARVAVAREVLAGASGDEARWEALELLWEAAQRSHSFYMLNTAAHMLGAAHIVSGAAVEGLLLLRAPARDWLLRGDARVWGVLHSIAIGLATAGDVTAAARLGGAIGDRLVGVSRADRPRLRPVLQAGLSAEDQARHARAGRELDAGSAVAEALQRIEALAMLGSSQHPVTEASAFRLTARQQEVAALVARGFTNRQIAERLGISPFTAETHVRRILDRLGAASRSEIAAWAARQPSS